MVDVLCKMDNCKPLSFVPGELGTQGCCWTISFYSIESYGYCITGNCSVFNYQKVNKLSNANSFCAKELGVENVLLNTLNFPILEDNNMLPSGNSGSRATYWKRDDSP